MIVVTTLMLMIGTVAVAESNQKTGSSLDIKVDNGEAVTLTPSEIRQVRQCVNRAFKIKNKRARKAAIADCLDAYLPSSKKQD